MKIAFGVEYDGSAYCGWQSQKDVLTVQATVEDAISKVANHVVRVYCAGRTDTGVHARNQVIHIDTEANRTERSWIFGINSNLPKDINIVWVRVVDEDFHARFSAVRRTYHYHILNQRSRSALLNNKVTWECRPLSLELMNPAKDYLIGEHDFSSFRSLACQAKTPVRTIHRLELKKTQTIISLEIEANAFLHHMVRNIAGVLMSIGIGKEPPVWAKEVLECRDRSKGGVTAPPEGLYLMRVEYPKRYKLPEMENAQFFT